MKLFFYCSLQIFPLSFDTALSINSDLNSKFPLGEILIANRKTFYLIISRMFSCYVHMLSCGLAFGSKFSFWKKHLPTVRVEKSEMRFSMNIPLVVVWTNQKWKSNVYLRVKLQPDVKLFNRKVQKLIYEMKKKAQLEVSLTFKHI